MLRKILFATILSLSAFAGNETGNGGDVLLSRFVLAKEEAITILDSLRRNNRLTGKEFILVSENLDKWIKMLNNVKIISVNKMLFDRETKAEVLAVSVDDSPEILVSRNYFNRKNVEFSEVVVLMFHEVGHKIGIKSHDELDRLGTNLVNEYKKNIAQRKGAPKHIFESSLSVPYLKSDLMEFAYQNNWKKNLSIITRFQKRKKLWRYDDKDKKILQIGFSTPFKKGNNSALSSIYFNFLAGTKLKRVNENIRNNFVVSAGIGRRWRLSRYFAYAPTLDFSYDKEGDAFGSVHVLTLDIKILNVSVLF